MGDDVTWISQAVDGKKPILMVLQVGWSGINPPKPRVFPTFHQERYMAYQAIIKGARGLLFFGMPVALSDEDHPYGDNWTFWREVLQPLALELGEKSPLHLALLAPDEKMPLQVTGADDVEFTSRKVAPFLYILAAKREGAEANVRFADESLVGDVEVMFEGRTLKAEQGAFTDRFAPNDVHVYKVRIQI